MSERRSPATLAERIAAWGVACSLSDVPGDVVRVAKRCIVDLVGVTLAGASHPAVRTVARYAERTYGRGPASVVGLSDRISAPGAALVNGMAGHVLDYDDTSYTGIMHGSTVVFPAALAATELAGGDGRRLLEAFIVGSEVAYAVAMYCTTRHYHRGWWSTGTFGALGAAAAAAKAMGLSAPEMASALGLAGIQAAGQKVAFGTDAKPYLAGRAAAIGVEAAFLAGDGLRGPAAVLEGERGFVELMNDGHSNATGIEALGKVWRLVEPGILFKAYPVCSGAHAAIELTQRLLKENGIRCDDVRQVRCEVTPVVAISLVYTRPRSVQEAQFSMPFAIGTVLANGTLDVDSLRDEALSDPRIRAAMEKVDMRRVDSLQSDDAPEGARVTITTNDGRQLQSYLGQPTGMPGNPMTGDQLQAKFLRCAAAGGLAGADGTRLLAYLNAIELATAGDLSVLTQDMRGIRSLPFDRSGGRSLDRSSGFDVRGADMPAPDGDECRVPGTCRI